MTDLEQVGGKNASLGEMISALSAAGIRVPGGFATTARTSLLTSVLNTIGWPLSASAAMRAMHSSAFSVESTNGSVTWLNSTPSNCVSRL